MRESLLSRKDLKSNAFSLDGFRFLFAGRGDFSQMLILAYFRDFLKILRNFATSLNLHFLKNSGCLGGHLCACAPVRLGAWAPVRLCAWAPVRLGTCAAGHLCACAPLCLGAWAPVRLRACAHGRLGNCAPVRLLGAALRLLTG